MKINLKLLALFSLAFLFALLFYNRTWGLNLFIFQLLLIITGIFAGNFNRQSKQHWIFVIYALLMATFAFIHHSTIAFVMSWASIFILGVSLVNQKVFSVHFLFGASLMSLAAGPLKAMKATAGALTDIGLEAKHGRKVTIYLVPLVLIFLFVTIYSFANPRFGGYTASFYSAIGNFFEWSWEALNWQIIGLFILGTVISGSFLYAYLPMSFVQTDETDRGELVRTRIKGWFNFKTLALKSEKKAGVFLLAVLNGLLVLLLISEIQEVWLGFEWQGGFLKEFVHEGIYLLIFSILISMAIVLYFFRGNQNFYKGSVWLKRLTTFWILLNAILVISVAVRNFYYIEYFALAYKRIGVFFFLAATLVGLYSIYSKVHQRKNALYLYRLNSLSVYTILCIMALINWDVVISKYNFSQFGKTMVELKYMSEMSDKALPYLVQSPEEILQKQRQQQEMLQMSSSSFYSRYTDADTYAEMLDQKRGNFLERWNNTDWLEWNPAEAKAFELLQNQE